jgi:pimeloyl-ACP methyl ester carboxylesterase
VIFETGAIASSLYYWKAQDEVAKFAHVCVYDRAGLGWSDPAPLPRTLEDRANDLHALLEAARLKGPYILAGHSAGGLITQLYARKWPGDLKGVVLIESSEVQFNGDPESVARTAASARQMGLAVAAAEAGREVSQLRVPGGPAQQEVALRAEVFRAGQDDLAAMSRLMEESGKFGSLGDTPLVVVSRGRPDPGFSEAQNQAWMEAQARLAALSTRSTRMIAANSGHNVHYDEPAVIAEAVRRIVQLPTRP